MAFPVDDLVALARQGACLGQRDQLLSHCGPNGLSAGDVDRLLDRADSMLSQGGHLAASHLLFALFALNERRSLAVIQRRGMLRPSRAKYPDKGLAAAVLTLHKHSAGFAKTTRQYLLSMHNLGRIYAESRQMRRMLLAWLAEGRENAVRGMLATVDWLFLARHFHAEVSSRGWVLAGERLTSPEEMAQGFSTVFAIYLEQFGGLRHNDLVDGESAAKGVYADQLETGFVLSAFREWEELVDRCGYSIQQVDQSWRYRVVAPSMEFHRARRLGFILYQNHSHGVAASMQESGVSVSEVAGLVSDELLCRAVFAEVPHPRFRIEVTELVAKLLKQLPGSLKEEALNDMIASLASHAPVTDLQALSIADGITVGDIRDVARFLSITLASAVKEITSATQATLPIVLQSLVPTFTRDELRRLIGFMIDESKADKVIALLSPMPGRYVDIQYQPFVPVKDNSFWVPLSVCVDSDMYRNPLAVTRRRLFADGTDDPLAPALAKVFTECGMPAKENVSYKHGAVSGDIDVLALAGDYVCALECKNSLLPTGVHEFVTSCDHVQKAGEQLSRFAAVFEDEAFRAELAGRTGLKITRSSKLVTGIVMANRMLAGYRLDGHPVRGFYELRKFLLDGTVSVGEEKRSYWLGETLSAEDVRRFFQEDITYEWLWSAIESEMHEYRLGDCVVEDDMLFLDIAEAARVLGFTAAEEQVRRLRESDTRKVSDDNSRGR